MHGGKADSPWRVQPRPSWVAYAGWRPESVGDAPIALADTQVSFVGPRPQQYFRMIFRNRDEAEVRRHGFIRINFRPPHRRVELHGVTIHRAGKPISQLNPFNFRLADETSTIVHEKVGPPRRISLAEPALLMRSPDLQVGDFLEIEYTVIGIGDPRLEAFDSTTLPIPFAGEPADLSRCRVLADRNEPPLEIRRSAGVPAPKSRRRRGQQEYLWEFKNTAAGSEDGSSMESIQVSNFGTWETVGRLNRPLFELGDPLPEVRALAATIASEHDSEAAQARAALDYVQHRLAFDTTNLGQWTSEPRPLADVLRRGAADCKGKSFLLMAILRELGVRAEAVLVNLDSADLRVLQPAPKLLDHVIVLLHVDGREVFVDPTRQGDRGDLWSMPRLNFRTCLVLAPGQDLVDIPHPCDDPEPTMATSIRFRLGAPGQPTRVDFRRSFRGITAVDLKQLMDKEFAGTSVDLIGQDFTGRLGASHTLGEIVHRDDAARNLATIETDLVIAEIWRKGDDGTMTADLGPSYMDKSLTLFVQEVTQLGNPSWYNFHRVETYIDMPEGSTVAGESFDLTLPGLSVRHEVTTQGQEVRALSELRACGHRIVDPSLVHATLRGVLSRLATPVRGGKV